MRYAVEVPTMWDVDVLVVGGGSAGSAAAVAAARQGARVSLAEHRGFLGGTGAAVLDTFYGFYTPGGQPRKVVGGLPDEVVAALEQRGALIRRPNTYGAGLGLTYDPELLKVVWDDLVEQAGVQCLLHTRFIDVVKEGARVTGAVLATRAGLGLARCQVVIDASGDAEVAARAGAPLELAGSREAAQGLTTTFRLIHVDLDRARAVSRQELWQAMADAAASGRYRLPRREGSVHITPYPGVVATNLVRIMVQDPTDPGEISRAEVEGRRQALEYWRFLKDRIPGYERSILTSFSTQIGIRESRRIIGEYWLTREDVLSARRFPDAVAQCGAPIEDHVGSDTRWEYVPGGDTYDIPYRCLLPQQVEGLLVAGRCLSASHAAHASVRSMGQCMAMGQAAGVAAALAARGDGRPRAVAVPTLQARLREMGAVLA